MHRIKNKKQEKDGMERKTPCLFLILLALG